MTNAKPLHSPLVIGVVGGIASGKSQVTRLFGEMHAAIVSADAIAHRVLQEPEVIDALVKEFGNRILIEVDLDTNASRNIDRKKLGSLVFGDVPDKRENRIKLEAIVHPRIRHLARSELQELKCKANTPLIILDAPLLIEGGWLPFCDRVVFVESPDAMRKMRAMDRGWTEQEWHDRESAQLRLSEKRKHATDIVVNDGTIEQLKQQVVQLVAKFARR